MSARIHLYTICWNEETLLPHFLEHYSQICDRIVVYDNFSIDNSEAICRKHPAVEFRRYETFGQIRDEIYLQIKNNCWKESKGKADWVIVCDIDEFIFHPDLPQLLSNAAQQGTTIFKSVGYEMVGNYVPKAQDKLFEYLRCGVRAQNYDKSVLFNPNAIEEINYDWGAHSCMPIGILNQNATDLNLLHCKFLSAEYVKQRYSLLRQRLSKKNKKMNLGIQYLLSMNQIQRQYDRLYKQAKQVI